MNDERRPKAAIGGVAAAVPSIPHGTEITETLRRRRAYSWRKCPLEDGRRDPLDPRRGTITRREVGSSITCFEGADSAVRAVAELLGVPWKRSQHGIGIWVPFEHAEDVEALLSDSHAIRYLL